MVKQLKSPLVPNNVLELGLNSGGRQWDVRAVIPRTLTRMAEAATKEDDALRNADKDLDDCPVADIAELKPASGDSQPIDAQASGVEMVCRPEVGH